MLCLDDLASLNAQRLANNFGAFTNMVPPLLNMVDFAHRLVGPKPLEFLSRTLNKGTGNIVPTWNPYLPLVRFAGHNCTQCATFPSSFRRRLPSLLVPLLEQGHSCFEHPSSPPISPCQQN